MLARALRRFCIAGFLTSWLVGALTASAQRQMEELGRGVVAVPREDGSALVSWRLLGTDPVDIAFDVYRSVDDDVPIRLNSSPIHQSTNWLDDAVPPAGTCRYWVQPVIDGEQRRKWCETTSALEPSPHAGEGRVRGRKNRKAVSHQFLTASCPTQLVRGQPYLSIPLRTPPGYSPNDASVGDLTGDGEYEIVLQQTGRSRDNSQAGITDPPILEAYRLDGTFLWRINLGRNIRDGAHYTQLIVYDLDGDGRAEIACKTADGTIDGQGNVLGDPDADYRNQDGYVLDGPEWLTVFDGRTGAALATVDHIPPRGDVRSWGDGSGNRVDRFLAAVAYLDGRRPSLIMCRGYYTRTVVAAWNWRDGHLSHVWTFDSDDGTPGNRDYRGQGNHSLSVGDVDGDGCDEILYGACAIDHDGTGLYTTRLGHGDAMHLADIDPDRPGLEVWGIHENPRHPFGANLRDAATGQVIWSLPLKDPGRGLAMDIDPRHPGYECWTNDSDGLYDCKGNKISDRKPRSCNMGIWWDGDLLRELLDGSDGRRGGGALIDKWDYARGTTVRLLSGADYDCVTNNGTKANPCLVADILGDWREEVIWRTRDNRELRIFSTPIPTDVRLTTLMHDPIYRLSIAWQNVGYNQPAHPGFYLGEGMSR